MNFFTVLGKKGRVVLNVYIYVCVITIHWVSVIIGQYSYNIVITLD